MHVIFLLHFKKQIMRWAERVSVSEAMHSSACLSEINLVSIFFQCSLQSEILTWKLSPDSQKQLLFYRHWNSRLFFFLIGWERGCCLTLGTILVVRNFIMCLTWVISHIKKAMKNYRTMGNAEMDHAVVSSQV